MDISVSAKESESFFFYLDSERELYESARTFPGVLQNDCIYKLIKILKSSSEIISEIKKNTKAQVEEVNRCGLN